MRLGNDVGLKVVEFEATAWAGQEALVLEVQAALALEDEAALAEERVLAVSVLDRVD